MWNTSTSLYNLCINAAVLDCARSNKFCKQEFRILPDHVLFDFYYKVYTDKRLCFLSSEFSDFTIFTRMLKVKHKRTQLLRCFQTLLEHSNTIAKEIIKQYTSIAQIDQQLIDVGLAIGAFFSEGGWYKHSHDIFNVVENLCKQLESNEYLLKRLLDCYRRRIYVESSYSLFKEAENTFQLANKTVDELKKLNALPNLAGLYAHFSHLFIARSEYDEAYHWTKMALEEINENLPIRIIIDVLRPASKACVFKRRFTQAGLLIQQAVSLSKQLYDKDEHPSYSDTLMDYGFYLLNFDNIETSVKMYRQAVIIRKEIFGKHNIHVAIGLEELAYSLYVNEYNSGDFTEARECIEKAIKIMEKILPRDHVSLASTQRVKALILEEIALDMRDVWHQETRKEYFNEAEKLHKSALTLSLSAFGERNVQTAKHYGNLGRLYQSMNKYENAEQMHLQAIAIKEELLGVDDYEVGLSVGHLASLYNFHMNRYEDAEKLYLRSIEISYKLFGRTYSGLGYDYRGLIKVYTELQNFSELFYFTRVMREWKDRRKNLSNKHSQINTMPLKTVVDQFFTLC